MNPGYNGWWKASVIATVLMAEKSESLNNIDAKEYLTIMAEWAIDSEAMRARGITVLV